MPYISKQDRAAVENEIQALKAAMTLVQSSGVLNYVITRLVTGYLLESGVRYESFAVVTGVLKNVADELYRRLAAPYEELKANENGDIPEYQLVLNVIKSMQRRVTKLQKPAKKGKKNA